MRLIVRRVKPAPGSQLALFATYNNRSYRILKLNMDIYLRRMLEDRERDSEYVGMDFPNALPLADIAQAMGVSSLKVEDPDVLQRLAEEAIASGKPSLLDISIDGAL